MLREALRYVLIGLGFGLDLGGDCVHQWNDHEFKPTFRAGDRVWCGGPHHVGLAPRRDRFEKPVAADPNETVNCFRNVIYSSVMGRIACVRNSRLAHPFGFGVRAIYSDAAGDRSRDQTDLKRFHGNSFVPGLGFVFN